MKATETHRTMTDEPDVDLRRNRLAPVMGTEPVKVLDGMYVAGDVIGRRRTAFQQKGGGTRYSITLAVITLGGKLTVERWTDNPLPPDLPRVGERVCLPVTLQHFTTKNGVGTRLCWGATERGEDF